VQRGRRTTKRERKRRARALAGFAVDAFVQLKNGVRIFVDEATRFDEALRGVRFADDGGQAGELGLDAIEQCAQLPGKVGLVER